MKYSSEMKSIDPSIWGPSGWNLVHALAAAAAKDHDIAEVFQMFYLILPCAACQHNYKKHLLELPLPKDPKALLRWSYELHQRVNIWKGKTMNVAYQEVEKHWTSKTLSWEDVWTFIEAVVESHPGANQVKKDYVDALLLLFHSIRKVLPLRYVKRKEVVYKIHLRALLKEIKVKNQVNTKRPVFTCSSAVCQM